MDDLKLEVENEEMDDTIWGAIVVTAEYKGERYYLAIDDFDTDYYNFSGYWEEGDPLEGEPEGFIIDSENWYDCIAIDNLRIINEDDEDITEENREAMDYFEENDIEEQLHKYLAKYFKKKYESNITENIEENTRQNYGPDEEDYEPDEYFD